MSLGPLLGLPCYFAGGCSLAEGNVCQDVRACNFHTDSYARRLGVLHEDKR